MVTKRVAPYGDWESPLTAEAVTAGSRSLSSPRVDPISGRAFFLESRSNGTQGIVEVLADGSTKHVLPESSSASTAVYEYGGLPYAIIPGQRLRIIFSNAKDQSINLLHVDDGEVTCLRRSSTLRYADFDAGPHIADGTVETAWVLAVEEDHEKPKPDEVRNYVVAINVQTGAVKRLADTADFYMYPRFSPDGKKVAWKEWDHPDMPWQGCKLYWADWKSEGAVANVELVAGENRESISEPSWSPGGTLFFGQEKTNFRQLHWKRPGDGAVSTVTLAGLETAEIGDASFITGCQSYVFLSDTAVVAAPTWFGAYDLVHIDLTTGTVTKLDTPLKELRFDCLARLSSSSVLVAGAGFTTPQAVYSVTIDPASLQHPAVILVRSSVDTAYSPTLFSTPKLISFPSRKGSPARTVYGFFWPPHNPAFTAPDDGSLPPLLISPHGGPTGHSTPGLKPRDQYFLTRGYAFFAINFTGSSGHGRAYREALYGRWGVADTDDVADAVAHLAAAGLVDGSRAGVVGGSAGGYNVLQSLVHYPDSFAGGVCYCGVSDVRALDVETHKMESRYMGLMLGFGDDTSEEDKDALFEARSPLSGAERVRAPLLLVHGDKDTVVPISQSYEMRERIERRGGDVKMIVLEDEGHMFKRAESWQAVIEQGERWWRRSLLGKKEWSASNHV